MAGLDNIEKSLDEALVKNAPFQLPKNVKEWIVKYLPYINVFLGVVTLWAAWAVYNAARATDSLVDLANQLSKMYGTESVASRLSAAVWLAVIVMVVEGVLWIAAYSGTKARKKSGWNLLFYAVLVNALYGLVTLFTYYGGFMSFLSYALGTVIGLYFLFQIRSYYISDGTKSATSKATKTSKK